MQNGSSHSDQISMFVTCSEACAWHSLYQVFEEGTHFMVPWFERPIIYDVRARPSQITSTSGSRDLQMVSICSL